MGCTVEVRLQGQGAVGFVEREDLSYDGDCLSSGEQKGGETRV
jgi:hypothetical protein